MITIGMTRSFGAGGQDILLSKVENDGWVNWTKTIGGINDDWGHSIQQTSDGGFILAGATENYGAGSWDLLLAKLDQAGSVSWVKVLGGTGGDFGFSVHQENDGGYVVSGNTWGFGASTSDLILTKWNAIGQLTWAKAFAGAGREFSLFGAGVSNGNSIVTGRTETFGAGSFDLFAAMINQTGSLIWGKALGGVGWDEGWFATETSNGSIIVVGQTNTAAFSTGSWDILLVKFNATGGLLWSKALGTPLDDQGYGVWPTDDGGILITGHIDNGSGDSDLLATKLNATGDLEWAKAIGDVGSDWGRFIHQAADGTYSIAGVASSFGAGNLDFLYARLDSSGDIPGCRMIRDVSANITVKSITPTVTPFTPTMRSISPTVQNWPIFAIDQTPEIRTPCEHFPTSSSTSSSSSSSSTSTSSSSSTSSLSSSSSSTSSFFSTRGRTTRSTTTSSSQDALTSSSSRSSTFRSSSEGPTIAPRQSSSTPRSSRVTVVLGIVLGLICGIGVIGSLVAYLLKRKKSSEEGDRDDNMELTGGDSQGQESGTYGKVGSVLGEGKGKEESHYRKAPSSVTVPDSEYQLTPNVVSSPTNPTPDTTEVIYGLTP